MTKEEGSQAVILVDGEGRTLGVGDKTACHRGGGVLHAAFLVMIFNDKGQLLLTRRSAQKTLWPGYWDGTIASHYRHDEPRLSRVRSRISEESACAAIGLISYSISSTGPPIARSGPNTSSATSMRPGGSTPAG